MVSIANAATDDNSKKFMNLYLLFSRWNYFIMLTDRRWMYLSWAFDFCVRSCFEFNTGSVAMFILKSIIPTKIVWSYQVLNFWSLM